MVTFSLTNPTVVARGDPTLGPGIEMEASLTVATNGNYLQSSGRGLRRGERARNISWAGQPERPYHGERSTRGR